MNTIEEVAPHGPVDVAERETELANDVGVEALTVQNLRDVVDRGSVGRRDAGVDVHVAHQGDLVLEALRNVTIATKDQRVGLNADAAQRRNRVLRGLGLEFSGGAEVRHEGDVQEEDVVAADVVADLASGFEEGLRFDVADGATDFGDHDVRAVSLQIRTAHLEDATLDLVGDVRDDLNGVAEVLAAAFLGDDRRVDLAGGDVRLAGEVTVEEPLVVSDVEVGLGTVFGDEDLAVLEGVHGARIHIEIGIELLHGHAHSPRGQQLSQARGGQTFAERGSYTSADEDVLGGGTRVSA